ncbi:hypothetical protein [Yoonia vestfoldensis]|jgi:uncharacterized protein YjiS (DUF1127 family)|uniref:DUF1127 domain-containing protein n=1 Tax=Yoonia vestfoldensis TaxID=245188 RepID=A0A1Y0EF09_9RHOB|nr:hypothetical protein [Yoonia vestfoldensis]ARU02028.1 hypothetical protein LOKVESSMR4R_02734 [Yoonia vestfoldensis]
MAFQTDFIQISNRETLTRLVMAPLRALGRGIIHMSEATAQARLLHELNNMSDAQLEEWGMTRAEAMAKFLSIRS